MNPFGDGSNGALNVTSGITYLPLNTKLQYTTVNVGASGTIRPSGTTGSVLYIVATESITINGTINTSGIVNYGNNTWGVTIDGETFTSPGVANGGYGGIYTSSTRALQSAGFGGGGGGVSVSNSGTVHRGGNGGNGSSSPSGGGSITVTRTVVGDISNRSDATGTNGGSGVAYARVTSRDSTVYPTIISTAGAGGQGYGSNGAAGSGNDTYTGSGFYNYAWYSGGGGGAGGRAGRAGVHIVLKSPSITINGTINTSGTNGTNGGNGGRARDNGGWRDFWGMPGGGGGGGNGGNIELVYNDTISTPGTLTRSGGSGGSHGTGGPNNNTTSAADGSNGSPGSLNTTQTVPAPNFTANVTNGPRPLTINFTNLSTGGDSFLWTFGDGTTSTAENPTKTYTTIGTYTVSLRATNEVGQVTETKTGYITTTFNEFDRSAGGTIIIGGNTNRRLLAKRSAGGTIIIGGDTRAIVLRDAETLQDKTYLYKVYDPDGDYIEAWRDVISDLNFTHEINTIGSTTSIELARNSDSLGQTVAPLQDESGADLLTEDDQTILVATETRNQIGSGSSVDYNNRVDITAFYGSVEPLYTESMEEILTEDDEPILAELGAPNGRRVFTGFISEINSRYGNSETTIVQLTSYGYDLDQFPITTAYNNNTTTVPFNSYDPSDIIRTAVDRFVQTAAQEQISYTMRTATSIDTSGTVVSYTFRNNTYKEVLDKTLELLPSNWYYRVGLGDNTVYVSERSATPQHLFYLGKHIKALDLKGSILDVVNHTLFTGGGNPALYVERKEAPAQRTRRGLEVMADSRVTLESSAGIISEGAIEEKNKLQYRTTVEILSKQYDIETIAVGETVGFRNFGNSVDNLVMQVVGVAYTPDVVQLALETKPLSINKRLSDIQRNLTVSENAQTPATPS